jgi:hypothetical protein
VFRKAKPVSELSFAGLCAAEISELKKVRGSDEYADVSRVFPMSLSGDRGSQGIEEIYNSMDVLSYHTRIASAGARAGVPHRAHSRDLRELSLVRGRRDLGLCAALPWRVMETRERDRAWQSERPLRESDGNQGTGSCMAKRKTPTGA